MKNEMLLSILDKGIRCTFYFISDEIVFSVGHRVLERVVLEKCQPFPCDLEKDIMIWHMRSVGVDTVSKYQ